MNIYRVTFNFHLLIPICIVYNKSSLYHFCVYKLCFSSPKSVSQGIPKKKKSLFALQAVFSIISFFIKNLNKSNTSFASLCIWKSSGYCMIILHIDSYQWIINTKHLKLSTREKISMTKFLFPKMCCSVFWELQRFLSFHFLWIEKSRCPL